MRLSTTLDIERKRLRYRWRVLAGTLAILLAAFLTAPVFVLPAYATIGPVQLSTATLNTGTGWAGGGVMSICVATGGNVTFSYRNQSSGSCSESGTTQAGDHNPSSICLKQGTGTVTGVNYLAFMSSYDIYPTNHFTVAGGNGATTGNTYWYTITSSGECSLASDPTSGSGPQLDATQGTSTCSRILSDTTAMTGQFAASRTGVTHASVTAWDWDWGDSTTHGTLQNQNHTYGAISTQPTNGWTATITMTITASAGHYFSDGTSTKTGTCSLRVDFLNPSQSTAGSTTTGGSTGDTSLDACLPSGWNWVNPLALVGSMGCILKYLFIPSSTTVSNLGHLWDTATTKVPFSIVNDVVTYLPNTLDDFQDGILGSSPITGYAHGLGGSPNRSPICDSGAGGIHLCGTGGYPFFGNSVFDVHGSVVCSSTSCATGNSFILVTRTVLLFIIVAAFVYACWRGASEILK